MKSIVLALRQFSWLLVACVLYDRLLDSNFPVRMSRGLHIPAALGACGPGVQPHELQQP